jgi:hypothetical protein
MPIRAYPRDDGRYNIIGKETYYFKDKLRLTGAKWNSTCWVGSLEAVNVCKAILMVRARIAGHCCDKNEKEVWISEREAKAGVTDRMGCGWCDTSDSCGQNVIVLEIINV